MKKRPNFRIIENADDKIDWDELKKDYLDPYMCIDDICKKHDISRKKYYTFSKRLIKETGIPYKPNAKNNRLLEYNQNKHIYFVELSGKYRLTRFRNKKTHYYGDYDTLEQAREVRNLMIEHNWSDSYYENVIKPKYHPKFDSTSPMGFEEDFLDGMSVKDLRKKYSLTHYQYNMIAKSIKQKFGLVRKPIGAKV